MFCQCHFCHVHFGQSSGSKRIFARVEGTIKYYIKQWIFLISLLLLLFLFCQNNNDDSVCPVVLQFVFQNCVVLWAIPTFHCGDLAVDACIISRVVTNHRLTPECFKWLFYSHQNASACLSVLEKRFKAKRDTQKRHAMTKI